jgi:hypothetical protein
MVIFGSFEYGNVEMVQKCQKWVWSCGNDLEVSEMVRDGLKWQLMEIFGNFEYSLLEMTQNY